MIACQWRGCNLDCPRFPGMQRRNASECGVQFSTYTQVAFCDVRDPAVWPALVQVIIRVAAPRSAVARPSAVWPVLPHLMLAIGFDEHQVRHC